MAMRAIPAVGDLLYNHVGHVFRVVIVHSAYRFTVQPLITCGIELVPIGAPVRCGRSDFRL